ncbi:MAG: hypothetical protein K2M36_01485, partial [Clostridia bacterium]|nr:hypothetical protein [Clostridia bacterium]
MAIRKEIIVLSGGGHKGVVKISDAKGKEGYAKISCSLDFRPSNANLFVVGASIAKIPIKDVNQEAEVPFQANDSIGCVVRSSSLTMFGGKGIKSEMLAKIEQYNRNINNAEQVGGNVHTNAIHANVGGGEDEIPIGNTESALDNMMDGVGISSHADNSEASANEDKKREYVGVASHSDVNPLGEWTKYDGNNFYYAIKPQIDEMFICYPEEKQLGNTVPNSKWVRVDAEDGYYVVGLLYDEDTPSYICYGVPQLPTPDKSARRAPAELENMCVWLPLSDGADIE